MPVGRFLTDAEIYRRWGVSDHTGRETMRRLELNRRFPRRGAIIRGKRDYKAVEAFLDERSGLSVDQAAGGWEEHHDEPADNRRRTRARLAAATPG